MSTTSEKLREFAQAENGDECPLCRNGTVEIVGNETRCKGECGHVGHVGRHRCPTCGAVNEIVNQCRCDPDNMPTPVPAEDGGA